MTSPEPGTGLLTPGAKPVGEQAAAWPPRRLQPRSRSRPPIHQYYGIGEAGLNVTTDRLVEVIADLAAKALQT